MKPDIETLSRVFDRKRIKGDTTRTEYQREYQRKRRAENPGLHYQKYGKRANERSGCFKKRFWEYEELLILLHPLTAREIAYTLCRSVLSVEQKIREIRQLLAGEPGKSRVLLTKFVKEYTLTSANFRIIDVNGNRSTSPRVK